MQVNNQTFPADLESARFPRETVKEKRNMRKMAENFGFYFPTVGPLLIWMLIPLSMTIFFSLTDYNLLGGNTVDYSGLENFEYLLTDPDFTTSIFTTLKLVGAIVALSVGAGLLLALLFDQKIYAGGLAKVLMIVPFFVMPTVSALIWKNMMMDPVNGLIAQLLKYGGFETIKWFEDYPLFSIVLIVTWRWLPFAFLIFLTALQSLPSEQKEAAYVDGIGPLSLFYYIILPHLKRSIVVVVMILTIFQLSVFAEIFTTTSGGPGISTTNLSFLIYRKALLEFDVGGASAGGIFAVILANIVAFFLIRSIAGSFGKKA